MDASARAARAVAAGVARTAQAATVKGWRDVDHPTGLGRWDLAIADHYAPAIARAIAGQFRDGILRAAIVTARQVSPRVGHALVKAGAPVPDDPHHALIASVARHALQANQPDDAALLDVLQRVTAAAWITGGHVATTQLPGDATVPGAVGAVVAGIDWSTWQPGDVGAAIAAADGGMRSMLDAAGITIRGLNSTTIDRIGNMVADGLLDGRSVDSIAKDLRPIVENPTRALMIAHTETARAQSAATADTYAANGITRWDWLTTSGACPLCLSYEASSPHGLADVKPPGHPLCRCAMAPVIDTDRPRADTPPAGETEVPA